MRKPFSIKWIYLKEKRSFDQKYKFSNKNDMVCAWRNFKNISSRPLFTIIFRPKILFFVTYSILTGQTKVEFVKYWVLREETIRGIMVYGWSLTWKQPLDRPSSSSILGPWARSTIRHSRIRKKIPTPPPQTLTWAVQAPTGSFLPSMCSAK